MLDYAFKNVKHLNCRADPNRGFIIEGTINPPLSKVGNAKHWNVEECCK